MPKLFGTEQAVLDYELERWYNSMVEFTNTADGIFSEKGKLYDRKSPVWERIRFPEGFIQELEKKTDRLWQLLDGYDSKDPIGSIGEAAWDEVLEELRDICNYSRMFGALIYMVEEEHRSTAAQQADRFFQYLREYVKSGRMPSGD